jgi:DNA-binding CsgD family transcriptional regulator
MTLDARPLTRTGPHRPGANHLAFLPSSEPEELEASVAAFHDWWSETCRNKLVGGHRPRLRRRHGGSGRIAADGGGVASWSSLSSADLRLAKLVALGLTNREVGAQMSLSRRAVSSRLRTIFGELGIGSREELARLAFTFVPEDLRAFEALPSPEPEPLATITLLTSSVRCTPARRNNALTH